ncbi:MAG: hypothetical protein Q9226_005691 [Calogaya cf. arnoldii]
MVNWSEAGGIAAVVSALYLPFVLSPTAYGALKATVRWLGGFIWPAASQCRRLCWEDIPDGPLHDCGTLATSYYNPIDCYCGARTLDEVFNKAMNASSAKLVPKPKQLALNRRYILTDVKTLLAFVLCSTEEVPPFTNIQIREFENLFVAKIHGITKRRLDVTKRCLESRIAGYPPWYREHLIVAHGPIIPHPIRSRDDVHRAGWVVAVGLSKSTPLPSSWADVGLMDKPVRRVLNKMRDEIQPHFPQEPIIGAAAEAIHYMLDTITGSGVERYLTVDLHKSFENGVTAALFGSDCLFAMSLFNDLGPLSEPDRSRLIPILKPVIDAAFRGCYIVIQYLKNGSDFSRIPDSLEDLSRQVYLDLGIAN